MGSAPETPFDSIEGAREYIELLRDTIADVRKDIDADIEQAHQGGSSRQEEALRIVAHKLERLSFHVSRSHRLLNDLRTLRRLLLDERSLETVSEEASGSGEWE